MTYNKVNPKQSLWRILISISILAFLVSCWDQKDIDSNTSDDQITVQEDKSKNKEVNPESPIREVQAWVEKNETWYNSILPRDELSEVNKNNDITVEEINTLLSLNKIEIIDYINQREENWVRLIYNSADVTAKTEFWVNIDMIFIKKLNNNIFEFSTSDWLANLGKIVWDIKHGKQIFVNESRHHLYWVEVNNILYTNQFVYNSTLWELQEENYEKINIFKNHTFSKSWNTVLIKDIENGKQYRISWDIDIDNISWQFILKDWYFWMISKDITKIYYWKVETGNINIKSIDLWLSERNCWQHQTTPTWFLEYIEWLIYIKNWKLISKWHCIVPIDSILINLKTDILESREVWNTEMRDKKDFWNFELY